MYKRFLLLMVVFSLVLSNNLVTIKVIAESFVGKTEKLEINTPEFDSEQSNTEDSSTVDSESAVDTVLIEEEKAPVEDNGDANVTLSSKKIYAPIGLRLNKDEVEKALQVTIDGVEIATDQYEISFDNSPLLPDVIGGQAEIEVTVGIAEMHYSESVKIQIEMIHNESILFSVNQKLDLAIGLIEENNKFFLTGTRYSLDLNDKKVKDIEQLANLYTIEIYDKGKLSYEFLRLNEDIKKASWETFEKTEIKEDTVIRVLLANGTESNYHHDSQSIEIKEYIYFQVENGKLKEIDNESHYVVPDEIIKKQGKLLIEDVKNYLTVVDGKINDIDISNLKEGTDEISFDIKWKVNNSITLERNQRILGKDLAITAQPQKISVGTTTLGNLKDIISVKVGEELLDKNQFEATLASSSEEFIHVGTQKIKVIVNIPELDIEEAIEIPVTVTEGESLVFQGYLGTTDMAISVVTESGKMYLRATDFVPAQQEKLHPGFDQENYYKIVVHNGTEKYSFSRIGSDTIEDTWSNFKDQAIDENSLIYVYHKEDGSRLKYYSNDSTEVSADSGYYKISNGKFQKIDANLPSFIVPTQIGYSKENMTDTEVKSLILNAISFEKGSWDDVEITFTKLPDTTKDADAGLIKMTMQIDPNQIVEIEYEITFHSYRVEAVKQEVTVGTQLINPDNGYVNIWSYGRKLKTDEYTVTLKEAPKKNAFSLKDVVNNVSLEVKILSSGFKEDVIVPVQAIAKETISLHGNNDYVDIAISLIQENDLFYIRASDFTFMGENTQLHPITGNEPYYKVSIHQPGKYEPFYEFERKGNDLSGTALSHFKDQKVEEGSLVTIWRKENRTIKYWQSNSISVNHMIDNGNNPESYVVENGKLVRSNRAIVKFEVPEKIQYKHGNMSNSELEQLVRESLVISYGRVSTLSVKTLESPDNQAANSKGKYEISSILDNGYAYSTQIEVDFYLYSFETTATSSTPLEVPVGATSINQKLLNSVTNVREGSAGRFLTEKEYEIVIENDKINEYGKFLYNGEINMFEMSVNVLANNEKKILEFYTETIPGQTMTLNGKYSSQQDIGLSIVEEDDGLWLRASDFTKTIKDNVLYGNFYYAIEVIDENGSYTFQRFSNNMIDEVWKGFEDRKITKNTVINIYHMEDNSWFEDLRYYDDTQSWKLMTSGYYRVSEGKFEETYVNRPTFTVPEKVNFVKLNMTEAEQLDIVKKNITVATGDISDLELKFIKQPDSSVNESEAIVEISYEIFRGVFIREEYSITFYRTFVEANPQEIPVGTVTIQNPNSLVNVYSEDNELLPETAYEAEVITDSIKFNYVNQVETVDVKVKYEEQEEVVSVPVTIVHGEVFSFLGYSGLSDMGLALIKEEDGYWLRSVDFIPTSRSTLHDHFLGEEHYRIDIYNNNQIYPFIRMGEARMGNAWELFEDQRIDEETIINIRHAIDDQGRFTYFNSSFNGVMGQLSNGIYQMRDGHFVRTSEGIATYNVPEHMMYKSEYMTEREIRDLIIDSIEFTSGDISELHLEVLEYPDQEKVFDKAVIKITNNKNSKIELTTEYEIYFSAIQITAKNTSVPVGTTKLYQLNDFVEVKKFGEIYSKEKYRIEQVTETDINSFNYWQQKTEVTFNVIFEDGFIEQITIPLVASAEAYRTFKLVGTNRRTDMNLNLIYEDDKMFLRGIEFSDFGNGNNVNSGIGDSLQYKLEVYNEVNNQLENVYSFERKGSEKIGTGQSRFKEQELKEGSIISIWRENEEVLHLWTRHSIDARYEEQQKFLEGRTQKDYYIVENGLFKRITDPLPQYDMPESVELKHDTVPKEEIERLVKQSIIMQNGQIDNLSISMEEMPIFTDNASTATGKVSVSYEIIKGIYISEVHDVEFCLYSIKATPRSVVAGTLQLTNLADFVEVTRSGDRLEFDIALKDSINIDTFKSINTTVEIDVEITLKENNQKRTITLEIPVVPDYSLSFHGYNQSNDLAIFVANEQDGLMVRASNFEESNETVKTVSDEFSNETFYEIAFYDSVSNIENPRYTFTRLGSDIRDGGYRKFQPQEVSVGDIISIFRQKDSTIRYWNQDGGSDYEQHEFIEKRQTEYYRITATGFDRIYRPEAPSLNNIPTTLNQEVTGQSEPFNEIFVYYDNKLIASEKADSSGNFTIPLSNLAAGIQLKVTQKNMVGESEPTRVTVVQDIPAIPFVDTITDRTTRITGEGEPGATVTIKMGSRSIGTGTVNMNGIFTVTILAQKAGVELSIYQTNIAGDGRARVVEVILTSPDEATVDQITDRETQVKGTGKAGSAITLSVDGEVLGSGLIDIFGAFLIPIEAQEAGKQVEVQLSNAIGTSITSRTNVLLTAPDQPYLEQTPIDAEEVKGSGKAHSTVYVRLGEEVLGTGTVLGDGSFSVDIPNQDYGNHLEVYLENKAGQSQSSYTTVGLVAPDIPDVNEITDNDISVTGTGTIGAEIVVTSGSRILGRGAVSNDGKFSVAINQQKVGTKLDIYAQNTVGMSGIIQKEVKLGPPKTPTVNEIKDIDTVISGAGKPDSEVFVESKGTIIATGKTNDDGSFALTIPKQLAETVLMVYQKNTVAVSEKAATIVQLTLPKRPNVNKVNELDKVVTGTGKEFSKVYVMTDDGQLIGVSTVDEKGNFSVVISRQPAYTILHVMLSNRMGTSPSRVIMVSKRFSKSDIHLSNYQSDNDEELGSLAQNSIGNSSLPKILVPFDSLINGSAKDSVSSVKTKIEALLLDKTLEAWDEGAIDIQSQAERHDNKDNDNDKDKGIEGLTELNEPTDYFVVTTVSAGISSIFSIFILIRVFYVEKRYKNKKSISDKLSLKK